MQVQLSIMTDKFIKIKNNIELWYETFGDENKPAILLIMGMRAQGIFWPDEFCRLLADHGYYVIRYDHRDVGKSTSVDFANNPYDLNVLAEDAWLLLEKLAITKAHIIGTSMGGYLAQLLGVFHPEKILSLTLIASTVDLSVLADVAYHRDLAKCSMEVPFPEVIALLQDNSSPAKSIEEASEREVAGWKVLIGKKAAFDAKFNHELSLLGLQRAKDPQAAANHMLAIDRTVFNIKSLLPKINIPTLIIHGAADPILPISHGRAIADSIKNSKFIIIDDMGHMLRPEFLREIARMFFDFQNDEKII